MTDNGFEWRLQELMTKAGIYRNAELLRRLQEDGIDLSTSQVHRIVTEVPDRLNLKVLASLCRVLDVTPADLIEVSVRQRSVVKPKAAAGGANVVDLAADIRPRRARITRE